MEKVIVIPDVHVPFHHARNWKLLLSIIKAEKPDVVVVIGDFADFYSVSAHSKDPRRKDLLEDEVDAVNKELDLLGKAAGSARIIYCEGNHEDRLRRYLQDRAPALFGVVSARQLFGIDRRGWKWVPYRDYWRLGKVTFFHDLGFSGKFAAQRTLEAAGTNVVFGHTHRGGTVYMGEAGPTGKRHFALNVGWLGDEASVDYMHRIKAQRDWQQGFGMLHLDRGVAHAQFIPIVKGRCVVDGKGYS